MSSENTEEEIVSPKKVWIAIISLLVLVVILGTVTYFFYLKKPTAISPIGAEKAKSLEDFIGTKTDLLSTDKADLLGLKNKDLTLPLKAKNKELKMFLVPEMLVGGDAVYSTVAQLGNEFFLLDEENMKNLFVLETEKDAINYIDFILAKSGKTSYDRSRTTVWNSDDYEKIGCKSAQTEENLALPKERPVSQATKNEKGFLVDWVYSTPALPAGFHLEQYLISPEGEIETIAKPEKPFWSCGKGIMF